MGDVTSEERRKRIEEFTPLVRMIAAQLSRRLPAHIQFDDLISAGTLGLIDAVDKFDRAVAHNFKKYAEIRIKGAMLDELRTMDHATRTHRKQTSNLREMIREVEAKKGAKATHEEMAEAMGMSMPDYQALLDRLKPVFVMGFDDLLRNAEDAGDPMSLLPDPNASDPQELAHFRGLFELVGDAVDTLPEKERQAIRLHFFEDMTLKEVGKVLGVTESRTSQLVSKAIATLQKRMKNTMRGDRAHTHQVD